VPEHASRHTFCDLFVCQHFHAYLISFLILLLLATPLAAQTEQDARYVQAEKLFSEASQLLNEGKKESLLEAIRKFLEAAPLYHEVNDTPNEAVTFNQIGLIYSSLGETRKALDYFLPALSLFRAVGDRRDEASTLTNIGWIHDSFGEKQKALDYYAQALLLRRAVGDQSGEAATLNNIGFLYNSLGEKHTH
jgi:tetratricopeptide (TPR) repeat protein